MSGLKKGKKYDWKDSNMALVGSKEDKQQRKKVADAEVMWGQTDSDKPCTVVFRINKFKIELVPKAEQGTFYEGDSYIIFHQEKVPDSDKMRMDVYFWIGKKSTQDEYGTAAIKTVELDAYHNDVPVQHREVQGNESDKFKSLFPKICILKGGHDTGFRHVTTVEYKLRLLRVQKQPHSPGKRKTILVKEIKACKDNLSDDDVFIIDLGTQIVQVNGSSCSADEKYEATQYIAQLRDERSGKAMKLIVRDSMDEATEVPDVAEDDDDDDDDFENDVASFQHVMFRLSDASGEIVFTEVQTGNLSKDKLDPSGSGGEDVFICDFGSECYVWIGKGASQNEKDNGMAYAHNYLMKTKHPLAPVSVMKCGNEPKEFLNRFH